MRLSRSSYGLLLLLPLALAACAGGEPEAEAAPPAEPMSEGLADAFRDGFVMAYMTNNPAAAAAYYAENAVFYGAEGAVNGRAAIEAAFAQMRQAGTDSLGLTKTSFEPRGEEAIEQGTFVMRTIDAETKERTYTRGGYIATYARQPDGGFQIVKDSTWVTETVRP
jgi:ketosteroid isomerase-like protein